MESFWLCDDCLFGAAYEDYSTYRCITRQMRPNNVSPRYTGGWFAYCPSVPTSIPKPAGE